MAKFIEFSGLKQEQFQVKSNLKNVLHLTKFCAFCFDNSNLLFELSDYSRFDKDIRFCTLDLMVSEVFGVQMAKDLSSKYLCGICKENIEQAYMFITKTKNTSKVLKDYLNQINEHVTEVLSMINANNVDFANTVIVLQDYSDTNVDCGISKEICPSIDGQSSLLLENQLADNATTDTEGQDYLGDDSYSSNLSWMHLENDSQVYENKEIQKIKEDKRLHTTKITCLECESQPCVHEKYLYALKVKNEVDHSNSMFVKCVDCDYVCNNKVSLLGHVNKTHLHRSPYLCDSCGESFHSRLSYNIHKKHHPQVNMCQYCDVNIVDKDSYAGHVNVCRTIQRTYKCDRCPASFDDVDKCAAHIDQHSKQFSCEICLKSFTNETVFKKHRATAHKSRKIQYNLNTIHHIRQKPERMCTICCAKFETLAELKQHLKQHGPNEKHPCHVCDKSFETNKQYVKHIKSYTHLRKVDPNVRFNFQCQECDFTSQTNRDMEHHVNLTHLKSKPYVCHVCSKGFTTKGTLAAHFEIHSGVKRHQCETCESKFTSTTGLRKHVFRHHSGKMPHACDMCEKGFVYQSELELHKMRRHSERTVPCPLCRGKFHALSNVRRHVVAVHTKGRSLTEFIEQDGVTCTKELLEVMRDRRLPVIET